MDDFLRCNLAGKIGVGCLTQQPIFVITRSLQTLRTSVASSQTPSYFTPCTPAHYLVSFSTAPFPLIPLAYVRNPRNYKSHL